MNITKNIFKGILIIFFVIIPVLLIIFNMFFDVFGYILFVNDKNNANLKSLLEKENCDTQNLKIIFVDSEPKADDKVKLIYSNFEIKECLKNSESEFIKYIEEEGIDLYKTITWINYIYVIVIASVIFFRKVLENASLFSKFEQSDN